MSDLISRSALLDFIRDRIGVRTEEADYHKHLFIEVVKRQPTIEAVPVPVARGEWIDEGDYLTTAYGKFDVCTCSACKSVITINDYDNYCPACGADMRKGGA